MHAATLFTQAHHDTPPVFNAVDRRYQLQLDQAFIQGPLKDIRKNSNRVFLCLAYRYFCMSNQFFDIAIEDDIRFIAQQLGIGNAPQWEDYQAGVVFGWKLSKNIGVFVEGEYTKFWDSKIYNSSVGLNITLK